MAKSKTEAPMPDPKWQAESDLRTLRDAAEIRQDARRLTACRRLAREQAAVLERIASGPLGQARSIAQGRR